MTRRTPLSLVTRCLLLVALLLPTVHCLLPTAFGQSATATLSGTVVDQNGAVVPGVEIVVMNPATSLERTAKTNDGGSFTLQLLPPGAYTLTAKRDGFAPVRVESVVLNVADQKSLQIQLKAGNVTETVLVTNDASLIDESPAVGTVVDRQFVQNIPLNGRSFQSLIALTPGVVTSKANFDEQGQFNINGQRANANYYTVDGVSANFGVNGGGGAGQAGAGELPALNASGGFSNLVSIDALEEFRIQTSTYAPEFGRQPGGQISLVTRAGTNQFHGSVFDYFRNDVLDANDWFANARRLSKPRTRQNDFGGTFAGPVIIPYLYNGRDKTFFFFSYEGLRLRQPRVATTVVPSLSMRQSAPAAVQTLLNAFPIPNGAVQSNGLALFSASFSNPTTTDATSLRVDHHMNKLTFFARYNYAPSNTTPRSNNQLNNPTLTLFKTRTLTAGTNWLISPTMNNEFRANWSRQDNSTRLFLDNFGGAVPFTTSVLPSVVPENDTFFIVGVINLAAFSILGRNGEGIQQQLNLVDNLSMVRGSHQLKFGVDYRHLSPSALSRSADLTFNFSSEANVLNGLVNISTVARRSPVDYAFDNFSAYAMDTWKTTQRLDLYSGFGLRLFIRRALL